MWQGNEVAEWSYVAVIALPTTRKYTKHPYPNPHTIKHLHKSPNINNLRTL